MPKAATTKVSKGNKNPLKGKGIGNPTAVASASKPLKSILKKAPKAPVSVESEEEDEDSDAEVKASDEVGEDEEDSSNESFHLRGFSDDEDGSDSSDEDDGIVKEIQGGELPTIAKDDATVKKKLEVARADPTAEQGVLYLGHIPHGFYEDEMKAYFSQFGTVTRIRLSRSKKTGRSKGYAFIEFKSEAVAKIVAEVMDNYLMYGRLMQCKIVPKEKVHPNLWKGANRKFKPLPHQAIAARKHNQDRTPTQQAKSEERLLKRQQARAEKLKEMGIEFDIEQTGYKSTTVAPSS